MDLARKGEKTEKIASILYSALSLAHKDNAIVGASRHPTNSRLSSDLKLINVFFGVLFG